MISTVKLLTAPLDSGAADDAADDAVDDDDGMSRPVDCADSERST